MPTALPRSWQAWAIGSSITISAVLIVALALRRKQRHSVTFRGYIYGISVAFEVAAIFGTIWMSKTFRLVAVFIACHRIHRRVRFPWVVEGDRFSGFLWTALAMCFVCGVAAFLPGATENGNVDVRRVVSGLGTALVLWGAGVSTLP